MDRARALWEWFDELTDMKKVVVGSTVTPLSFASWLYLSGISGARFHEQRGAGCRA